MTFAVTRRIPTDDALSTSPARLDSRCYRFLGVGHSLSPRLGLAPDSLRRTASQIPLQSLRRQFVSRRSCPHRGRPVPRVPKALVRARASSRSACALASMIPPWDCPLSLEEVRRRRWPIGGFLPNTMENLLPQPAASLSKGRSIGYVTAREVVATTDTCPAGRRHLKAASRGRRRGARRRRCCRA